MLAAAVRHEARMRAPVDDTGTSTRAHVEAAVRRGSIDASALDGPEIPDSHAHLWTWHQELERVRRYDGATGAPLGLTYLELDAWARLSGRRPSPLEVDALLYLDAVSRAPDVVPTDEEH